jgi:hypothetical protein
MTGKGGWYISATKPSNRGRNRKLVKQGPFKRTSSKIETPQMDFHVNSAPLNGPSPELATLIPYNEGRNCPTKISESTGNDL